MTNILTNNKQKLNLIYKLINQMANEKEEKLVRHFYSKGYTLESLAKPLGVSKQMLSQKYPDLVRGENHE